MIFFAGVKNGVSNLIVAEDLDAAKVLATKSDLESEKVKEINNAELEYMLNKGE